MGLEVIIFLLVLFLDCVQIMFYIYIQKMNCVLFTVKVLKFGKARATSLTHQKWQQSSD